MTILEAKDISKSYTVDHRRIQVLSGISLSAREGEFLVIQGSSGSGKTTLLSLLSGLDRPDTGRIFISGTDITDLPEDALAPFRNGTMGFVFQSFHLVPSLTALENVMFPAELRRDPRAAEKAASLIDRVGLSHRTDNFPHQLSGGEKQRIALCRALVNDPVLIFADEPTGNLDSENGRTILELLAEFRRERNTTLVLVTHNSEIADRADRRILLRDGALAAGESHAA